MSWIPLNLHSQYSVLQATSSIAGLVQRGQELNFPALALTDSGNLHGAVEFTKTCQAAGIKPLIGIEVFEAPGSRTVKIKDPHIPAYFPLTLIAKDECGYRNLCKLSSQSYFDGFYYVPRIDRELLRECAKGLIALAGAPRGKLSYLLGKGDVAAANAELKEVSTLFGSDLYLQLQNYEMNEENLQRDQIVEESWLLQRYRDDLAHQIALNQFLHQRGSALNIPLLAAQQCYYLRREDWYAHQVLLNVCSGEPVRIWQRDTQGRPSFKARNPKRQVLSSHEYYFKSADQMSALFSKSPHALQTPWEIAQKCELQLDFKTKHYPVFTPRLTGPFTAKGAKNSAEILHQLAIAEIDSRYGNAQLAAIQKLYPERDPQEVIRQRLESEFTVIAAKEMADYLLIVGDFIRWAKDQKIPVGPGRGSGAGSILCYLIGITDIEPLRFQLFFERFINPERPSYPDIDVDICMVRRNEVISYMLERYGSTCVAHIITFGKMKAKLAIKDVGRVLSVPLHKVNALAKLIPDDPAMTLMDAQEGDEQLRLIRQEDEEIGELLALAQTVEGSIRNTGVHAAGVIIGSHPLVDFIPLCVAKDSTMPVAQYSMKPLEELGMLKIDFLGLKTLTCIQEAINAIERSRGLKLDWVNLPLDDLDTFAMLNRGKTQGVFQLESSGMQDLARNLHLDRFEEIIAVLSLYRPGPMEMIPSFINRKHGKEPIDLDHPLMGEILSETYGIMVYQEQVMQIAQQLAGYTLAEGDVLRRAMGKKNREEMAGQRKKFLQGAAQRKISRKTAEVIFGKIEKFAQYGFNKSHAAAYGYLTYVTAYLKTHHPAEWMAALMTHDNKDTERVADCIAESRRLNLGILPPDVNESGTTFRATTNAIRFALTAVKGMGEGAVEAILKERERSGNFADLIDFIRRIDAKKMGKRGVELLVDVGAFDYTGKRRDALRLAIEPLWEQVQKQRREKQKGVISLFATEEKETVQSLIPEEVPNPLPFIELLRRERELLGFYLTGNPLDLYEDARSKLNALPFKRVLEEGCPAGLVTAFIVEEVVLKISQKTQQKFAILTVSDGMRRMELPLWSDMYKAHAAKLQPNAPLGAVLSVDQREGLRLTCSYLCDLTKLSQTQIDEAQAALARALTSERRGAKARSAQAPQKASIPAVRILLDLPKMRLSDLKKLKERVRRNAGPHPLELLMVLQGQKSYLLKTDLTYNISTTQGWLRELMEWQCVLDIQGD